MTGEATVVARDVPEAAALLGMLPRDRPADVVLLGPAEGAQSLPARRVLALPRFADSVDALAAAPAIAAALPRDGLIVLASTPSARDLAGWLAIRRDVPIVCGVRTLRVAGDDIETGQMVNDESARLVHHLDGRRQAVVLTKPPPPGSGFHGQPTVEVDHRAVPDGLARMVAAGGASSGTDTLAAARTVVCVGRGIGRPDHLEVFRRLAERLGASLGATRAVVDAGWLPLSCQIGQTGVSVGPDLYLGFGVSGAAQHLAGMRASRTVVAVNTDRHAALCREADLVVVADAVSFAQALTRALPD
ncbi:electron transfer flavoprotein subunit alpha/FixB family protein [Nonomuraea endophytica]|uniref:Electron transfer flavoprotein alpha subunit n=1 Tax=Nonomuraea endophytica TaxID=714136 RepID=A0A7W8A8C3_9ACTN|nr:electron transfer flavoprotein subunit alpha/FixB family protein [Nonomuraea endophytica]MBB5081496.1 electron transfer flavoprotein alpha subunit [Nonomuraea endophytica]